MFHSKSKMAAARYGLNDIIISKFRNLSHRRSSSQSSPLLPPSSPPLPPPDSPSPHLAPRFPLSVEMPPPLPMSPSMVPRTRTLISAADWERRPSARTLLGTGASSAARRLGVPPSQELEECIDKGVRCMISLEAVHTMIVRRAGGAAGSKVIRLV
jgi:hypothetical protein